MDIVTQYYVMYEGRRQWVENAGSGHRGPTARPPPKKMKRRFVEYVDLLTQGKDLAKARIVLDINP